MDLSTQTLLLFSLKGSKCPVKLFPPPLSLWLNCPSFILGLTLHFDEAHHGKEGFLKKGYCQKVKASVTSQAAEPDPALQQVTAEPLLWIGREIPPYSGHQRFWDTEGWWWRKGIPVDVFRSRDISRLLSFIVALKFITLKRGVGAEALWPKAAVAWWVPLPSPWSAAPEPALLLPWLRHWQEANQEFQPILYSVVMGAG